MEYALGIIMRRFMIYFEDRLAAAKAVWKAYRGSAPERSFLAIFIIFLLAFGEHDLHPSEPV
jgi:hypothetical protein